MALRNQPYIPLYVQDFLTDEKLNECSAATQGIYIKIMCILHKSEKYGSILLKQKDKHNSSNINNFAIKFTKLLPFASDEIELALTELIDEGVMSIDGDILFQKRMVIDNELSDKRARAGSKGGRTKTQNSSLLQQNSKQTLSKGISESQANSEYEYEIEYISIDKEKDTSKDVSKKKSTAFQPPTFEEVQAYCLERKNDVDPQRFIDFYESKGWYVGKNKMKNWKAAVRTWEQKKVETEYLEGRQEL